MDSRVLPDYDLQDVLSAIQKIVHAIEKKFKVQIEISTAQYVQSAKPTLPDAPVVEALNEAIKTVYNVEAFAGGVGAGTVASYIRKKDYPGSRLVKNQPNCPSAG